MGKYTKLLFSVFIIASATISYSQTKVKVSEPRIKLVENIVHIYFDILDGEFSDHITVSLEITDISGTVIEAHALEGDIGENISSGNNKHIMWSPSADGIFLDAQIYFVVSATYKRQINEGGFPESTIQESESGKYSRTGLILQSLAVPGLGMTRLTGKPHWLRAVAGYGCIAASIMMQEQAKKNYNSVAEISDYEGQRDLYDTAIKQDNISELLAYTAIGVWVLDFVWTMIGTRDMKTKSLSGSIAGIGLGGSLDPLTYAPTLKLTYKF